MILLPQTLANALVLEISPDDGEYQSYSNKDMIKPALLCSKARQWLSLIHISFEVRYASAIGRYDQAINLRFIHRMAKIEVSSLRAVISPTSEAPFIERSSLKIKPL